MSPHFMRPASTTISVIAGLQYGLDTGSIGSIIEMDAFKADIGVFSNAQQGVFVAVILFSASVATLASGHLADAFSRKQSLKLGAAFMCLGALISASAQNMATLHVARVLYGFGIGDLCELAPPSKRGVVGCTPQLFTASGVAIGFFLAFGSSRIFSSLSWRTPFIVQAFTAACLLAGSFFIPFSPRWLAEQGRTDEARAVLVQMRESDHVAKAELDENLKSKAERLVLSDRTSFLDAFRPPYARRTWLTLYLMASQQTTGIDFALYYAPRLFAQAGFGPRTLVIGGVVMAASFFVIGFINASGHSGAPGSMKWAIIRARTSSLSQMFNWDDQFHRSPHSALLPPRLHRSAPTSSVPTLTLAASLVCAAMLPDTANLSLEEIDRRFDEDSRNGQGVWVGVGAAAGPGRRTDAAGAASSTAGIACGSAHKSEDMYKRRRRESVLEL
ncbi:hypothetical protein V8E36_003968 [Tilletia maclaganii]